MGDEGRRTGSKPARKDKSTYIRLMRYAQPHWKVFVAAILGMVIYAATETGFAALMKPLLDDSFVGQDPATIRQIPLLLMALFLVRGIASFASSYGMSWVGRKVIFKLREEVFNHYLILSDTFFDNHTSGQLISKLTFNVEQVAEAATKTITIVVRDSLTAIGLLAYMIYLSGLLSAIFLILGPIIALVVVYISRRFRRLSGRVQDSMAEITHVSQEIIDGHRVVKTFSGQDYESKHFEVVNDRNQELNMKLIVTTASSVPFIQFLAASALSGIIYLATLGSMEDINSAGTFVSFLTAMMLLLPTLKRLTTVNASIQKGIAAADSIFFLLDEVPEPDTGDKDLSRAKGKIEYQQVCFRYAGSDQYVLKDISLVVEPGQTVAIVGKSGSGKSTLVNLLPRFYELTSGCIFLDGVDIREYKRVALRNQIALVTQQVTLFNDTIAGNIAYGSLADSNEEKIIEAAEAAYAMEFIDKLPEKLHTQVGENGVLLSGGQRQRIAIARALLKNAPIIILDEATSALDTESERYVQAGLERLRKDRTTFIIAHRLSTIEKADKIVVMDQGRIIEVGSHNELLRSGHHYAALHSMQFTDN